MLGCVTNHSCTNIQSIGLIFGGGSIGSGGEDEDDII